MFKMINRAKNQKGFTLVELMVVVVIIGVLVAIAIPLYNNATASAKDNTQAANIRIIEGAVEQYKAINNKETYDGGAVAAGIDDATWAAHALSSYMAEWPKSPGTYALSADGVLTTTKDW